jgi:hypothetical protein
MTQINFRRSPVTMTALWWESKEDQPPAGYPREEDFDRK